MISSAKVSIIIPCLNEAALGTLLTRLSTAHPSAEIIVVDDGSEPPVTAPENIRVMRHAYTIGNGGAIKTGARNATGDVLVFLDADGQHDPQDVERLLNMIDQGYDMVVGARVTDSHASSGRRLANSIFNRLASIMTGYRIRDLTSGFRAARARAFRNFLYLLPNGFSYPATSTMAFFRCGYSVGYIDIKAHPRRGDSKIKPIQDGLRFLLIIFRIGALFSPMRFFLPLSAFLFLSATGLHAYTYFAMGRFTNMGAVLYLSSLFTFLFGVISEQISALHYRYSEERRRVSPDQRST